MSDDLDTEAILDALAEVRDSIADLSARVESGDRASLGARFDRLNMTLAAIQMRIEQRGEA